MGVGVCVGGGEQIEITTNPHKGAAWNKKQKDNLFLPEH